MTAGFQVALHRDGAIEIDEFASPDDPAAALVSRAADAVSGATAVLMGHLYYREDLLRLLPEGTDPPSDAALALALFRHQGWKGPQALEGDFSLVLFDPQRRCLWALRDPLGNWPLFWTAGGGTVHAGTSLLALRQQLDRTAVDLDFLASFLMYPFGFTELPTERTAFTSARRVLPGHLLGLDTAGRVERPWRWDWQQQTPSLPEMTLEEAGQRFADLFREAVRQRLLPGRTVAHLSGGMDSSYVACIARDLLAGDRLPTLSLVYDTPSLAGEKEYIRMVVEQGGLEPHYLPGDSVLDFDWFERDVPAHDEPYAGLPQFGLMALMVEQAGAIGADRMLTGLGAEVAAEGNQLALADLVRRGRWLTAWREARLWAQARNEGPLSVLAQDALAPLVPPCLRDGIGPLLRGGRSRRLGRFTIPPWVRPAFAREHQLWSSGLEAVRQACRYPYEQTASVFGIGASAGDWANWYLAGPRGIQSSHPFLDRRLLAFGLGLPHKLRNVPGASKPLLQEAAHGVLPEAIRTRRFKRGFNDVYRLGLARGLDHLEEMVRRSAINELGLFDTDELVRVLHQVAAGVGDMAAANRLDSTLALIAWFDRLQAAHQRRACWAAAFPARRPKTAPAISPLPPG